MSTLYTMVAPCFFGTESTLNFEVKRLGAQNIQVTDGRVAFQGGADVIAAANLNLRTRRARPAAAGYLQGHDV